MQHDTLKESQFNSGRFTIGAEEELTCGDEVELLLAGRWMPGRVEHNRREYVVILESGTPRCVPLRVGMPVRRANHVTQ